MSNLSNTTPRQYQLVSGSPKMMDYPMAAAKIYEGSALSDTGSPSAGTNVAETLVAGENFIGFSNITIDNGAGVSGQTINVVTDGCIILTVAGSGASSLGKSVYASDGNTFTLTAAGNSAVGTIRQIISAANSICLVEFHGVHATGTTSTAATQVLTIPVANLSSLANAQVLNIDPGFNGTIKSINFRVVGPATTASKLATLTGQIATTPTTGGVVALTSANCTPAGAQVAGSAVTGANTFTNAQAIGVTVSSVTAFVEGSGIIEITVVNTDLAAALVA